MKTHTDVKILSNEKGLPLYAILPYKEYLQYEEFKKTIKAKEDFLIPHEIVKAVLIEEKNPIRAWREYLNLTQEEVANNLNISQPAYRKYENNKNLRKHTKEKIAKVLGIEYEQIDI